MTAFKTAAAAVAISLLAACGGGGGGSGGPPGTGGGPARETGRQIELTGRQSNVAYGPSATRILDYLKVFANCRDRCPDEDEDSDRNDGLGVFIDYNPDDGRPPTSVTPTLRMAQETNPEQRALVRHAVSLINNVLPYERHIRIGQDAGNLTPLNDIPGGQIFVDFAPRQDWITDYDGDALGLAQSRYWCVNNDCGDEDNEIIGRYSARIWMLDDPDREYPVRGNPNAYKNTQLFTMAHEILHTLALGGHVDHAEYPGSLLGVSQGDDGEWYGVPVERRDITQLGPIDIAAMIAARKLYERNWDDLFRLGRALLAADITPENLGEWNSRAVQIEDSQYGMTYGIRHYHDVAIPYASGTPATAPLDRSIRSGSATWNGGLLGFDAQFQSVQGDAAITVDIADMNGTAAFTDIVYRNSGNSWGRDLDYAITVGGNFLYSDDGAVNGRFYGSAHEGVAGTVERADLTAAFGARQR